MKHRTTLTLLILIYLSLAIGLRPGGSGTVHIYTQTVHRTTQKTTENDTNKNKFGTVRAVPCLCELYPGICLTTEEKARQNLLRVAEKLVRVAEE